MRSARVTRTSWRLGLTVKLLALLGALALLVAACGDDADDPAADPDPDEATADDEPDEADDPAPDDDEEEEAAPERLEARQIFQSGTPLVGHVLEHEGFGDAHNIDVEFIELTTGAEAIAAMLGGSAEFVTAADARFVQAANEDLPVVAVGLNNTGFRGLMAVPADSEAATMEDLVGQHIGMQIGSGVHIGWLRYLDALGLEADDFEVSNFSVPDMPAALDSGAIDAAIMWQPHVANAELEGITNTILDTHEIADTAGIVYPYVLLTPRELVEDEPEVVEAFVHSWVCSQQWIPENEEQAIDYLGDYFEGLDREVVETIFHERLYTEHFYMDETVMEDLGAVGDVLIELESIEEMPDLDPYIDNSFAERALEEGC